jgi:hypothetical protein
MAIGCIRTWTNLQKPLYLSIWCREINLSIIIKTH